jgi:hypothetical protein
MADRTKLRDIDYVSCITPILLGEANTCAEASLLS